MTAPETPPAITQPTRMVDDPSHPESAGRQALNFLVFLVKVMAMLGGLAAFGFVIFLLRRSLG
ncbi:hypothetical protein [Novosphingobium lentum]|uniref:hypothetical protein n=1 Tax=Novosphingobium lentum TaxID=145287 RepID=UPI00082D2B6B|nr:hypothetical protein [Novosphingobium lentum]